MSDTPRTDALCHEDNVLRIEDAVALCRQLEHELAEAIQDGNDKSQSYLRRAQAAEVTARPEVETHRDWLIWSNEHGAWWGPDRCGYPRQPHLAGRYTLAEARDICKQRSWDDSRVPPETMIHEAEVAIVRRAMNSNLEKP